MTQVKFNEAQGLLALMDELTTNIKRATDIINDCRKGMAGEFVLLSRANPVTPGLPVQQEEALPFFEEYLAKAESRYKELKKKFEEL